jgi:excisionase family DNA binding protein
VLTVKAVAERLAISQATVYGLVTTGKLRSYRIGGAIRISEEQLQAFLEGSTSSPQPQPTRRLKLKNITLKRGPSHA